MEESAAREAEGGHWRAVDVIREPGVVQEFKNSSKKTKTLITKEDPAEITSETKDTTTTRSAWTEDPSKSSTGEGCRRKAHRRPWCGRCVLEPVGYPG